MLRHLHCVGKLSVFRSRDSEVLVRLLFSQYPAKTMKWLEEVFVGYVEYCPWLWGIWFWWWVLSVVVQLFFF